MIVNAAVIECRLLMCVLTIETAAVMVTLIGVVNIRGLSVSAVIPAVIIGLVLLVVIIKTLSRENIHTQVRTSAPAEAA